jgi:mono/diheme cytochrome c family protein
MNLYVLLPVLIVTVVLLFLKLNRLTWMVVWWVAIYIILNFGIDPPLPSSIILMFMAIISLALLVYLTADSKSLESVKNMLVNFVTDSKYKIPLVLVIILIPVLVAIKVYSNVSKVPQPPLSGRTIHPPPPAEIQFKGKTIDLVKDESPFRKLESSNPESFRQHVLEGRRVYYQNCVFCHGDDMDGDGLFAHGFDPIPANFKDPTTIAMLQETYLFWRIAKGGPGLPDESSPWASAMPAWEKFLSEDEIWDVILFLYDHTGQKPRAKETLE